MDLSFVVWRCRGIVRQLMEVPPEGQTYVVVVAKGVASLQLCRGVPPKRAGEEPRLELVERDLVVEPWDQWHLRAGNFVKTWWTTPLGELVASRVRVRRWPHKGRPATDDLLMIRGRSLRKRIDAYARENPGHKPLAVLDTSLVGEEIRGQRPAGARPAARGIPGDCRGSARRPDGARSRRRLRLSLGVALLAGGGGGERRRGARAAGRGAHAAARDDDDEDEDESDEGDGEEKAARPPRLRLGANEASSRCSTTFLLSTHGRRG